MFVSADSYDRFMGRYSRPLTNLFADFSGLRRGQRVLDVGCGPGALTAELVERLGASSVAAVDPSEQFVDAIRHRWPGVDANRGMAEALPFQDQSFNVVLAQLVVHFMSDPLAGVGEMRRVTREEGVVAACVWDMTDDKSPLGYFWRAARDLDPTVKDESWLTGGAQGELAELFTKAGLVEIAEQKLVVSVEHPTFEDWWEPFTLGVGPAGAYATSLDPDQLTRLRELCRQRLPEGPFTISATAWAARGRA